MAVSRFGVRVSLSISKLSGISTRRLTARASVVTDLINAGILLSHGPQRSGNRDCPAFVLQDVDRKQSRLLF